MQNDSSLIRVGQWASVLKGKCRGLKPPTQAGMLKALPSAQMQPDFSVYMTISLSGTVSRDWLTFSYLDLSHLA